MNKRIGVILGYVVVLLNNFASFFITPLMILTFGNGEYGVYKYVMSFYAFFALADLGISNSIIRYVSEYRARGNKNDENKFTGFAFVLYTLAALIILIVGVVLINSLTFVLSDSFTANDTQLAKKLLLLIIISSIVMLYSNLFDGIIKSYEEFKLNKSIQLIKVILKTGLMLILLLNGVSSFGVMLADTLVTIVICLILGAVCFIKIKIRPSIKKLDVSFIKPIFNYTFFVFLEVVAFQMFWNMDNLILGKYSTPALISIYSIGTLINSYFQSISLVISEVIMPDIVKKITLGMTDKELTDEMIKIGRIKLIVLGVIVIGFAFVGKQFITLWVGESFLSAYYVAMLVIMPQFITFTQDVGSYALWAKNKHKVKAMVTIVIAILNCIITIILVPLIGIVGAAIGTCFAYTVGYVFLNNIYYKKLLNIEITRFFKETFNKIIIVFAITSSVAYIVANMFGNSWMGLVIKALIIAIVYMVLMYTIGINNNEKTLIKSLIKRRKI